MSLYDLFRRRVAEAPDAEAVIFGDVRVSYAALDAEVHRIARGLVGRGVGLGDRVLGLAGNSPSLIAIYLATARIGAVYVPVSPGFRVREAKFVLNNAEPRLAFVQDELLDDFLTWSEGVGLDIVIISACDAPVSLPPGAVEFDQFGRNDSEIPDAAIEDDAPVLLCYTSGTTSTPKPVLHSQRSEIYNAQTYAEVWGLGPGDRGVVAFSLAWVFGLSTTTAALLVSGGTVILLDRFHPARVLDTIRDHRATALWGTMSMYVKLLEVIRDRGQADLSSLRLVVNGGEPCPPPLVHEFETSTGLHLLGSYATSEARPVLAVLPGDKTAPEGTAGQLVPGAEIRLEGPDGTEVAVGESGHALLRCPGVMTAYYGEPELTADRLTSDGWFKTGDLLQRDADGYYFVVGRQSDMIIRSGVNIAPAEVESALVAHPSIADAAVVGVPDRRSGEAVRAYVVAARGTTPVENEIRLSLSKQLATYKIPQEFLFVEELPRTERGKVDRAALRRLAAS